MKRLFLAGLVATFLGSPVLSAQTYFSLHAGTDGVGVDVSNVSPYFPVVVAPVVSPVRHVHVPLMPGYVPDYEYRAARKHYRKAAKEYRKAARHYRRAVAEGAPFFAVPQAVYYEYDDDDMEDFYEDYYKHAKKQAKKYKKYMKHAKKHHKHHHKHHHHDD